MQTSLCLQTTQRTKRNSVFNFKNSISLNVAIDTHGSRTFRSAARPAVEIAETVHGSLKWFALETVRSFESNGSLKRFTQTVRSNVRSNGSALPQRRKQRGIR